MINGFRFMKLFELFLEKLSNTTLFEMATERKLAKRKVTDLSPQIIDHLIKIFTIDDPSLLNHWIVEVDGWIHAIQRITLKPSNKPIDLDTMYQWIIFDSDPHYDGNYVANMIKIFKRQYKRSTFLTSSPEDVMSHILLVIKQACTDASQFNFISVEDYL